MIFKQRNDISIDKLDEEFVSSGAGIFCEVPGAMSLIGTGLENP